MFRGLGSKVQEFIGSIAEEPLNPKNPFPKLQANIVTFVPASAPNITNWITNFRLLHSDFRNQRPLSSVFCWLFSGRYHLASAHFTLWPLLNALPSDFGLPNSNF
jgi:hypothetical protein